MKRPFHLSSHINSEAASLFQTVTFSMGTMHFVFLFLSLSTIDSPWSVSGQILNEATVSILSSSQQNATVEASGQHNEALISQKEKANIDLFKKIIYPFILCFGTFGNVMIILIHKRTVPTSPLSVFFTVLAVSDLLLLYSNCFPTWLNKMSYFNIRNYHAVLCKLFNFCVYVSGVLSAWTLVVMTVQRAVCVLWPHRAHVICTAGKSKVILLSMVLFIIAIHAHILYGFNVLIFDGRAMCVLLDEYTPFLFGVWSWVDLFIFLCYPGCVLPSATACWCGS